MTSVKGISFSCLEVGQNVSSSKLKYTWKIEIDGVSHVIDFFDSKVSGKKRLFRNGILVVSKKKHFSSFTHSFQISGHVISILEAREKYELLIDKSPFSKYYQPNYKPGESIPSSFAPKFHTIKEESKNTNPKEKIMHEKGQDIGEFTSGFEKFDEPIIGVYSQFKTSMPSNKKINDNMPNEQRKMKTNFPEKIEWNNKEDFEFEKPIHQQNFQVSSTEKFSTNVPPKTKIFSDLLEDPGPNSGLTNDLFTQSETLLNNNNNNTNIKEKEVQNNQDLLENEQENVPINENMNEVQNDEIPITNNQNEENEQEISKEEIKKNINDVNQIFMDLFNDKAEEDKKMNPDHEKKEQNENNDNWQEEVFNKIENTISKDTILKFNPKASLSELQRTSKSPEVKPQFNTNIPVNNPKLNTNPFLLDLNNGANNQFVNPNINANMNPSMMMYMTNMMQMNMMYNGMMNQQNQIGK